MGQSYTYQCRPFHQWTSVEVTQGSTIQFWSGIVSGEIQLISRSQNISFTNSNTINRFIQCIIGLSLKRREINFKARIPHTWYILILSMVKNIFLSCFWVLQNMTKSLQQRKTIWTKDKIEPQHVHLAIKTGSGFSAVRTHLWGERLIISCWANSIEWIKIVREKWRVLIIPKALTLPDIVDSRDVLSKIGRVSITFVAASFNCFPSHSTSFTVHQSSWYHPTMIHTYLLP